MKFICPPGVPATWIQQGIVTNSGWYCGFTSVAIDPTDLSIVAVGYALGTVDFSSGTAPLSSGTNYGITIAKYDSNGNWLWSKMITQGSQASQANAVTTDSSGNIYVTGFFATELGQYLDFGNGHSLTCIQAGIAGSNNSNIFVAKYDKNGSCQWATSFGGDIQQAGYAVRIDGAGNILIAGNNSSLGDASFVCSSSPISVSGRGQLFIAKMNNAGVGLWAKRYGGVTTIDQRDNALAVVDMNLTGAGDLIVVGYLTVPTNGPFDLGGGYDITAGPYQVKYLGTDGSYVWERRIGGSGDQAGGAIRSVVVDVTTQDFIVVGCFSGSRDFGGVIIQDPSSGISNAGIFVARYPSDNSHCLWAFTLNVNAFGANTLYDYANSVVIANDGTLIVSGQATSNLTFDGNLVSYGPGSGFINFFTVAYSGSTLSSMKWYDRASDTFSSTATSVATNGKIAAVGKIYGNIPPPSTILDGVNLWTTLRSSAPILVNYPLGAPPPPTIPNPADFIPIIYPSSSTTYTHAVTPSDDGFGVLLMDTSGECLVCNGIVDGTPVTFYGSPTNASLPSNITAGTTYYVSRVGAGPGTFYLSTTWPTLNLVAFVDAGSPTSFVRKNNNDWLSPSVNALQKLGFKYTGPQPAGTVSMYWQYLFDDAGGTNWTTQEDTAWYPWSQPNGVSLIKHATAGVENINGYKWRAAFSPSVVAPGMPVPADAAFCAWQIAKISTTIVLGGSVTVPSAPLIVPRVATVQTIRGPIQTTSF